LSNPHLTTSFFRPELSLSGSAPLYQGIGMDRQAGAILKLDMGLTYTVHQPQRYSRATTYWLASIGNKIQYKLFSCRLVLTIVLIQAMSLEEVKARMSCLQVRLGNVNFRYRHSKSKNTKRS
jgi:hypothetical protein